MSAAVILTPAYTHVHPRCERQILYAQVPWLPLYGHSDLPRARSVLIESALARSEERVILIDADTVPLGNALAGLANDTPVTPNRAVFGLYPLREGTRWSVSPEDPAEAERAIAEGRMFRIKSSGLGFCAIHRGSLERLAATLPMMVEDTGTTWHPFCVPFWRQLGGGPLEPAEYYADDGSLCVRLRENGTELWCDPTLRAAHAVERLIKDLRG